MPKGKKNMRKRAANKGGVKVPINKQLPPRPWRGEGKGKPTGADVLIKAEGGQGTDPRDPSHGTTSAARVALTLPSQLPVTKVVATVDDRAVSYIAMGIVLRAIKHGLLSQQTSTPIPYYAFRYLNDALVSAMQGTVPALQQAPNWFWELLYAVKPKTAKCKTGQVSYSWNIIQSGQGFEQAFALGSAADQYFIFWGNGANPDVESVNGFAALGPVPAYTVELGQTAISSLWNVYATQGLGQMVGDPGDGAFLFRDTSAFSVVYPEIGDSYFASGGLKTTIYSERNIDAPVLAKLAKYQPAGSTDWRGWHKAGASALSPCYMGTRACEFSDNQLWRNKTSPTLKFYNFDEFFEVLSLTLALALENADRNSLTAAIPQSFGPCPLTAQEVQIILRQTMMPLFNNEMVQDIRLMGANLVDLLPFTCGPNGVSMGTMDMQLPMFLAENIRCCARLTSTLRSGGKFNRSVSDIIPVLCRPAPTEQPQLGNYTWVQRDGTLAFVYAIDTLETPINLVDCSALAGSPAVPVYLDLSRSLTKSLIERWNEWITKLASLFSGLVTVGSAQGVRALNTNIYTNFTIPILAPGLVTITTTTTQIQAKLKDKDREKAQKSVDEGKNPRKGSVEKKKHFGSDKSAYRLARVGAAPDPDSPVYFGNVGDSRTSSLLPFTTEIWNVAGKMILPVSMAAVQIEDAGVNGWKIFNSEVYEAPRSTVGGIGGAFSDAPELLWPSALERHLSMASIDVRMPASDTDNETIAALKKFADDGRGGFLSDLVGTIGGALGIPFVPQIASMVGKVTGL